MLSSLIATLVRTRRQVYRYLRETAEHRSHIIREVVQKNGALGFICFGGPPVHFQIVSDDPTQEL